MFAAQTRTVKKLAEFNRIPCGHVMAWLDVLLVEWLQNPDDQIAIVYRSHRYRKSRTVGSDGHTEVIRLNYANADDGLNWAKGIPKYLLARLEESKKLLEAEQLKKQVVMIDGGYDEEIEVELWLVPPGSPLPKPVPVLNREDLKFGAKTPFLVPDHINCYSMYQ